MKPANLILTLSFLLILTSCTKCDPRLRDVCDGDYRTDSVLLNLQIINPSVEYKQYDTIWINSDVSDELVPLSGNPPSFISKVEELYLTIQPYQLINNPGVLPYLQYANIEFNPVLRDGSLENLNGSGYIYKFRRNLPYNKISAGLVAGRPGTYILECTHSTYPYSGGGNFQVYNGNNTCISYLGKSTFPEDQQNLQFWDTLTTSSVSLMRNYGSHTILKESRNYFIIKVVP
jgi:hypothetical protein